MFPRLDGRTLALVSHTGCGYDGLVLQILERPVAFGDTAGTVTPNRLHIDLGPFSATYDLMRLGSIDDVVAVDAGGNSFQLTGLRPDRPDACRAASWPAAFARCPSIGRIRCQAGTGPGRAHSPACGAG